jgi:dTDP-4-amino-4,6-dideoxygalactose transaminase
MKLAVDGGPACLLDIGLPFAANSSDLVRRGEELLRGDLFRRGSAGDQSQRMVLKLERRWSNGTGQAHVIACHSGAVAAHLGLAGFELGPGDEVICPAGAFFSSIEAISGAVPVHVDVDPRTLHIDPSAVEAAITHRTGAIVALDMYGTPADYDALESVAERHGLPILEDASQARGARYNQRPAGSLGNAGFSSLPGLAGLPGATSALGQAGVLCTDDDGVAASARRALLVDDQLNLGATTAIAPGGGALGWTYRLSERDAADADAGLSRLDEETAARTANGNHLLSQLREVAGIGLPEAVAGATHVYCSFLVLVQPDELGLPETCAPALRDTLRECLMAEGLPVERWQPEPIGGPLRSCGPRGHRPAPPPVGIPDHPVADAVRASALLFGRDNVPFGAGGGSRAADLIAVCFTKVLVENRDRLCQLVGERMVTTATI